MKPYKNLILCASLGLTSLCACTGPVFDSEGDCETVYELQFVYDHNIKWADAFSAEVSAVTVYIFERNTGRLVLIERETGDDLARDGYAMRLNIPAGDYDFVAWCGEGAHDGGKSFKVAHAFDVPPTKHQVTCYMNRNRHPETGAGLINHDNGLSHLYHGYLEATLPDSIGAKVRLKMPLVKNTNAVKIVLQSLSGKPVNPNDFEFSVTDSNGYMDWDNSMIDDEQLTYTPWGVSGGSAEIIGGTRDGETISAVVADMTVGRLMTTNRPVLTVHNKAAGKDVLSIPLNDYALMIKGNYKKPFADDQEYLDRQDEYNMTFFLDSKNEWMNAYIHINSWKVVLSEHDID